MKNIDWLKILGRPLTLLLFVGGAVVTAVDLWDALGAWKWYAIAAAAIYVLGYLFFEARRLQVSKKWLKRFAAAGPLSGGSGEGRALQWRIAKRTLTIEGENAHFVQSEEGWNVSDQPVDHIVRSAAGDKAVEFDAIGFQAWFQIDNNPEQEAFCEPDAQRGSSFRCRISFRGQVVNPNARLSTRRQFLWPGAVATKQEYWLLPLHYPAGELQAEFRFRDAPQNISFWKCTKHGKPQPVGLAGPVTENGFAVYRAKLDGEVGWYGIEWTMR